MNGRLATHVRNELPQTFTQAASWSWLRAMMEITFAARPERRHRAQIQTIAHNKLRTLRIFRGSRERMR